MTAAAGAGLSPVFWSLVATVIVSCGLVTAVVLLLPRVLDRDASPESSIRNHRLRIVTTIVILVGGVMWAYRYVLGQYLRLGYPWSTSLYVPKLRFGDWYETMHDVSTLGALHGRNAIAYTPFQHLFLAPLGQQPTDVSLALVILLFAVVLLYFLARFFRYAPREPLSWVQTTFVLTLSYPVLFLIDRGNTEMFVFVFLFLFVLFYYEFEGPTWLWVPFLAAAIAMKLYPAFLLLVPMSERRYRGALACTGVAATGLLASTWILGVTSGLGFVGTVERAAVALASHAESVGLSLVGVHHGHSLWGPVLVTQALGFRDLEHVVAVQQSYLVAVGVIASILAIWILRDRLSAWQKLTVAVFGFLLLPFSSHDYTLVHVLFPLALFVASPVRHRFDTAFAALFALLLVPADVYYFVFTRNALAPHTPLYDVITSTSVYFYPIVMVTILVLIYIEQRATVRAGESAVG